MNNLLQSQIKTGYQLDMEKQFSYVPFLLYKLQKESAKQQWEWTGEGNHFRKWKTQKNQEVNQRRNI